MIAPSSLSAFSPIQSPSAATRVAAPAQPDGTANRQKTLQAAPVVQPSGYTPRGSVLDLSV